MTIQGLGLANGKWKMILGNLDGIEFWYGVLVWILGAITALLG